SAIGARFRSAPSERPVPSPRSPAGPSRTFGGRSVSSARANPITARGGRGSSRTREEIPLLALELQLLVGRRPRIVGDEAKPGLRNPWAVRLQKGQLPDRQVHDLLVDQLLDAMQHRLALLRVELGRMLPEESVDIGIAAVGVRAARGRE